MARRVPLCISIAAGRAPVRAAIDAGVPAHNRQHLMLSMNKNLLPFCK